MMVSNNRSEAFFETRCVVRADSTKHSIHVSASFLLLLPRHRGLRELIRNKFHQNLFLLTPLLFLFFFPFLTTVSVHCKDTRIAVQVRTNKPFNGRIYALGRSETCNIDVINSDAFRLDLTMAGQDCNTQSVVSQIKMFIGAMHYIPIR